MVRPTVCRAASASQNAIQTDSTTVMEQEELRDGQSINLEEDLDVSGEACHTDAR